MGSKIAANFDSRVQDGHNSVVKPDSRQDDQSELSLAISKAVTQVLESSDWRALSFPLQGNSGKHSKAKNAVKRPMNPFMLYAQAARKKLSVVYPDLSYAKLSKTLGRIWKSLDQVEKQPFVDEAARLREKHKIDHPDYKFQPKRREKKRSHSPNKDSFENGKITTVDVLKVLSSSVNANKHHNTQNLWSQSIHNGMAPRQQSEQPNVTHHSMSPPPPYTPNRSSPVDRASPNPLIPKMNGNTPQYEAPTQHQTNDLSSFSRYLSQPPPLHRATTASLFSPSAYRVLTSQPSQSAYTQFNEIHNYPIATTTPIQNYPSDLSLAIGNSFLKCSAPPQLSSRSLPHLTSNEDHQSTNLLTGVNQILRDMFGTDKNSVI